MNNENEKITVSEGVITATYGAFNSHLEQPHPTLFRIAEYPDGRKIMQGGRQWWTGNTNGVYWEDLPLVQVDECGAEINEPE